MLLAVIMGTDSIERMTHQRLLLLLETLSKVQARAPIAVAQLYMHTNMHRLNINLSIYCHTSLILPRDKQMINLAQININK